jgi:peptidoglycan/LPS O-acetylase OafA/YrhL
MPRTVNLKAVVIGSLVDLIGGSVAGAVALLAFSSVVLRARGVPADQVKLYYEAIAFKVCGFAFSLSFSVLGGFVAARIAKRRELVHAGATGLVRIAVSLLVLAISRDATRLPIWHWVLIYVTVLPAALLGGYLGHLRSRLPTQDGLTNRRLIRLDK